MKAGIAFICIVLVSGCQASGREAPENVQSLTPTVVARESLPAESSSIRQPNNREAIYAEKPIVLYSLSDQTMLKLPLTKIPYYRGGDIAFLQSYVFKQHEEGHQPWLANGIDVVTVNCANLTGDKEAFKKLRSHGKIRKTDSGIVIRQITNESIEMTVPKVGKYKIYLAAPEGTSILFIRKIMLYPETLAVTPS